MSYVTVIYQVMSHKMESHDECGKVVCSVQELNKDSIEFSL